MGCELSIEGEEFRFDGRPTCAGRSRAGVDLQGRLFNARLIQGVFDDACPATRQRWAYPDTRRWDPDRNTDELCAALPEYRRHGLRAITVGLQGGGSIYEPEVYDRYHASAFAADGSPDPAWFDRLGRIVRAADEQGMAVIVSCFYFKHARHFDGDGAVRHAVAATIDLLRSGGHRNLILEIANEIELFGRVEAPPVLCPERVHELIELAQAHQAGSTWRMPVACSTCGGDALPVGRWAEVEDLHLPHGNGCSLEQLAGKLRRLREREDFLVRPRPVVVNEDDVEIAKMETAVRHGAGWGYYDQGYGSGYGGSRVMDWSSRPREGTVAELSGFQTLPVNWGINTPEKRAFFHRLLEMTGGDP